MLFDDLFYPGNPGRRQEVATLRGEIVAIMNQYELAWNGTIDALNGIFAELPKDPPKDWPKDKQWYGGMVLPRLTFDVTRDTIDACLKQINAAIATTKGKLEKFVADILKDKLPADWETRGLQYDPSSDLALLLTRGVLGALTVGVSAFLFYYVFSGVGTVLLLLSYGQIMTTSLASILGGALGGLICGTVAFIIADVIASAITGAIERKQLQDAIDALTALKKAIATPLTKATAAIAGVHQCIQDGFYRLGPNDLLVRAADGKWYVQHVGAPVRVSAPGGKALAAPNEPPVVTFVPLAA